MVLQMDSRVKAKIWRYNPIVSANKEIKEQIQKDIQEYYELNDNGEVNYATLWDAKKSVIRGKIMSIEWYLKRKWGAEKEELIRELHDLKVKLEVTGNKKWLKILKNRQMQLKNLDEQYWNKMNLVMRQRTEIWGRKSAKQMAKYLKNKKEKANIIGLRDKQGVMKYNSQEMECILKDFYSKLYDKEEVKRQELEINLKVEDVDREALNGRIREEEIIRVIKALKPGKAPGPDGFTGDYYKEYMEILLPHLEKLYNNVLMDYITPRTWKNSEIILIPKPEKDLREPGSYRPISLLNQDYKIFMKILANRLENILPKIIGRDQYGFIKGRKIYEPIRNIVNVLHHANKFKRKLALLKLDIYKAFDKVNHEYLFDLCEKLNLGNNFCQVLREVYKRNKAYIRVNGNRTEEIRIRNGTKQGCPLSPMLFAIAIEIFANKIRKEKSWRGYQVGQIELKLNLYADDAIIVTETPLEMMKRIMFLLQEFKEQSGLRVNLEKSEIICLNTGPKEQLEIRKVSGIKLGCKKMRYLGIWLFKNPERIAEVNYTLVWKKMDKQIKNWKNKKLRKTARIRAIKMLVIPKILYLMQVISGSLSKNRLKDWDTRLNKWIAGNKKPRIKRKWLIAMESEGGWGIPCLEYYRDAYQIDRIIEMQALEGKPWAELEKEINNLKDEEILCKKWSKIETSRLLEPMRALVESWSKWQKKLNMTRSKLATLNVLNEGKEGSLTQIIRELKGKGIDTLEQLYEVDGRFNRKLIENMLSKVKWLHINMIASFVNSKENKDTFFRQELEIERVIKEKKKYWKSQAGTIYRVLLKVEDDTNKGLTRQWEEELDINEWEMGEITENISKIKNMRIREMRRKILHKWYYTPAQLARFQTNISGKCWHGCANKGVFMHMIWECPEVQKFWKLIQGEVIKIIGEDWTINKEQAVLIKFSEARQDEFIKTAAIESAQATIVLGWKDKKKWTIKQWQKYMVDNIHYQINEYRVDNYNEEKLKAARRRWEKVKNYLISSVQDANLAIKVQSLYV